MSAQFWFILPKSFRPREFLKSPKLVLCEDDARYFVSLILTKTARGAVDDKDRVHLRAEYLRQIMHNRFYKAVIDALLEGEAVRRYSYRTGERSFGYTLSERFIDDKHVRVAATDSRLIGRLEAFHRKVESDRRSRMKPVHFALEKQQFRLRINGDLARDIISGLPPKSNPFDVQGILVSDIERGDFHVNPGRYGRLSNNITSLKRETRCALHVNGAKLKSVDISCCQPALIAKTARRSNGERDKETEQRTNRQTTRGSIYDAQAKHPEGGDFDLYCSLVQSGRFYDFMLNQLADKTISRDDLKKRFLADVVAKRKANVSGDEYPSVVEDRFCQLFPSVYRFIRRANRYGWEHKNLIRRLQREESQLVIETVAHDLVNTYPRTFFISLHDAIYSTERNLLKVVRAFETAFDVINFPMHLKVAA